MAAPRYFLADSALTAFLTLSDTDGHRLLAIFDQIAENPTAHAVSVIQDWDGRLVYVARIGRFEIGYVVTPDERVTTFTLVRPRKTR